jgi:hypothetical protein
MGDECPRHQPPPGARNLSCKDRCSRRRQLLVDAQALGGGGALLKSILPASVQFLQLGAQLLEPARQRAEGPLHLDSISRSGQGLTDDLFPGTR